MRLGIVILGILGTLLVAVVVVSLKLTSSQDQATPAVTTTVEDFLQDVANGDSLAASQLFASSVKGATVNQSQIDVLVSSNRPRLVGMADRITITSYGYQHTTQGETYTLAASVDYKEPPPAPLTLNAQLVKESGAWKLLAISFNSGVGNVN